MVKFPKILGKKVTSNPLSHQKRQFQITDKFPFSTLQANDNFYP